MDKPQQPTPLIKKRLLSRSDRSGSSLQRINNSSSRFDEGAGIETSKQESLGSHRVHPTPITKVLNTNITRTPLQIRPGAATTAHLASETWSAPFRRLRLRVPPSISSGCLKKACEQFHHNPKTPLTLVAIQASAPEVSSDKPDLQKPSLGARHDRSPEEQYKDQRSSNYDSKHRPHSCDTQTQSVTTLDESWRSLLKAQCLKLMQESQQVEQERIHLESRIALQSLLSRANGTSAHDGYLAILQSELQSQQEQLEALQQQLVLRRLEQTALATRTTGLHKANRRLRDRLCELKSKQNSAQVAKAAQNLVQLQSRTLQQHQIENQNTHSIATASMTQRIEQESRLEVMRRVANSLISDADLQNDGEISQLIAQVTKLTSPN